MNNIEKVQEILMEYKDSEIFLEEATQQICQLFEECPKCGSLTCGCRWEDALSEPKPDEGRLLTDEAIETIIKDAECQERVERIFEEIEKYQQTSKDINLHFILSKDEWQALKKKELEDAT